jgi:hypothetical protein
MKLVSHHTDEGFRMALIVKTGRKWMYLLYVGAPRLKKVALTETRYFRNETEATKKQIRQINRIARTFGATKRLA